MFARSVGMLFFALFLGMPFASAADLPQQIAGWRLSQEVRTYGGSDLWRHIDGAAEQYLEFGCLSVAVAYYVPDSPSRGSTDGDSLAASSGMEIAIEIYQMDSELGAFGLYMQERPLAATPFDVGAEGYVAPGNLDFFGGRSYIKMRCEPEADSTANRELRLLAHAIAEQRSVSGAMPPELSLLPRGPQVAGSVGFVPRAVLGLSGIDRAVKVTYRKADSGGTVTLYMVASAASPGSYTNAAEALRKRCVEPLSEQTFDGARVLRGVLKYHGPVLLAASKDRLALVSGRVDELWARALLKDALWPPAATR